MNKHIAHPQDKADAKQELDNLKYPYRLLAIYVKPEKGTEEYETWKRSNSFLHRGVIPTYSRLSGLREDEAKSDFQKRFACVAEYSDYYEVESIGDMSLPRLNEFIEQCQIFLVQQFGEMADKLLANHGKTKIINK